MPASRSVLLDSRNVIFAISLLAIDYSRTINYRLSLSNETSSGGIDSDCARRDVASLAHYSSIVLNLFMLRTH